MEAAKELHISSHLLTLIDLVEGNNDDLSLHVTIEYDWLVRVELLKREQGFCSFYDILLPSSQGFLHCENVTLKGKLRKSAIYTYSSITCIQRNYIANLIDTYIIKTIGLMSYFRVEHLLFKDF